MTSRQPSPQKWPWLVGGAILIAAAVGGVVVAISTGTSSSSANQGVATTKTYSDFTNECGLVSPALLAQYVPGARCSNSEFPRTSPDAYTRSPSWLTENPAKPPATIKLNLTLAAKAPKIYESNKQSTLVTFPVTDTITTSAPYALGDEAYLATGASRITPGMVDGRILLRAGNAVIDVTYSCFDSVETVDAAIKAISADILNNLH